MASYSTEKDGYLPYTEILAKLAKKNLPQCPSVEQYEKLAKIGQGTFGEVFKARHRTTKKLVALKRIMMENEKEGFPITAIREIKILQNLKHDNVVNLIEICRLYDSKSKSYKFFLTFDFCEHDLAGLLSNTKVKFSLGEIKMVIKQMLNGLYFIHSNNILHRDMKAANILITKDGTLKIADFGLARAFSGMRTTNQPNKFTNRVITLWYRPPELLLGERNYGPAIDLWGCGCIMAEMWTRTPIMQGRTEQHQLQLITQLCGSITPATFPGCEKLDLWTKLDLPDGLKRKLKDKLRGFVRDALALDLLDKFLTIDPVQRIDSDSALNHDFFWLDPLPVGLAKMLQPHTRSMFEYLYSARNKENVTNGAGPSKTQPNANDGPYERVF